MKMPLIFFLTLFLFLGCESIKEKQLEYLDFDEILTKEPASEVNYAQQVKGALQESDSILKYSETSFIFDLFQLLSRAESVEIEIKIPVTSVSSLLIPTVVLMSVDGTKHPLRSTYFDIVGGDKEYLVCRWIGLTPEKGKYFIFVASDNSEKGNDIHSGVISYFSPAYYNFSKKYKTTSFGNYQILLNVR